MNTRVLLSLILIAACSGIGSRPLLAQLEDVIQVPKGTRLMMDLETPLDSSVSREGDEVYLRIWNDVRVGRKLAIPRDVVIKGTVSRVQPSMVNGKKREAKLHIRLGEIKLTDGGILKVVSEPIKLDTRDSSGPTGVAKVLNGGSAGLSQSAPALVLGGTIGGGKGVLYGAAAAATAGIATGIFKKSKSNGGEVELFPGSLMETFLSAPPPPALSNQSGTVVADNNSSDAVSPPAFNSSDVKNTPVATEGSRKTAVGFVPSATKADNVYTVKVDVNLVPIDVVVQDGSGQPKASLRKEDFRIF
jgi:hypothetical protein